MKKFALVLFIFCSIQQSYSQKKLESVYDKLIGNLDIFREKDKETITKYQKVKDYVKAIRDKERETNKLGLNISFGLTGNNAKNVESYVFNTSANITKDFYPYSLDLKASISTQFFNGVLQENISDYHIGLDFFLVDDTQKISKRYKGYDTLKSDLTYEGYVYADRYANQFLNIEQRYEIGGGIIFNFYSGSLTGEKTSKDPTLTKKFEYEDSELRGLTPKGKEELKKLFQHEKISISKNRIEFCSKESCSPLNGTSYKGQSDEDGKVLKKAHRKLSNALKKKYSSFRLAMLTGVFYEIEKGNASDSVLVNNELTLITKDIETTNFLRWQLRPTLEFKTDKFSFKLKPYLKLPMPWDWYSDETVGEIESKKVDYLADIQSSIVYQIDPKFSVGFVFRHLYDNAPKREVDESLGELISASNDHTYFNFKLAYKL